jgi:hypothetical protein
MFRFARRVNVCAVIQPDSGEAKNTTALATSSGSPMRPIIARAAKRSSVPCQSVAPRPCSVMSVRTKPGATALTVMPFDVAHARDLLAVVGVEHALPCRMTLELIRSRYGPER